MQIKVPRKQYENFLQYDPSTALRYAQYLADRQRYQPSGEPEWKIRRKNQVLAVMPDGAWMSAKDIATAAGLSKSTVLNVLADLTKDRLVISNGLRGGCRYRRIAAKPALRQTPQKPKPELEDCLQAMGSGWWSRQDLSDRFELLQKPALAIIAKAMQRGLIESNGCKSHGRKYRRING